MARRRWTPGRGALGARVALALALVCGPLGGCALWETGVKAGDPTDVCGAAHRAFAALASSFAQTPMASLASAGSQAGDGMGAGWAGDRAALVRGAAVQLEKDVQRTDDLQTAFDRVIDCRRDEARRLAAEREAGRVDGADAERALADLAARVRADAAAGGGVEMDGAERFMALNEKINPGSTARVKAMAERLAREPAAAAGGQVAAQDVRVHDAPSLRATRIGVLRRGDRVAVVGGSGAWKQIRLTDGRSGYAAASALRPPEVVVGVGGRMPRSSAPPTRHPLDKGARRVEELTATLLANRMRFTRQRAEVAADPAAATRRTEAKAG